MLQGAVPSVAATFAEGHARAVPLMIADATTDAVWGRRRVTAGVAFLIELAGPLTSDGQSNAA